MATAPDSHADLLSALDPAPDVLLDMLRSQVDDELLRDIAKSDYGMEFNEHLRELRQIRNTGCVPVPFDWVPKEVLTLAQWSEPGRGCSISQPLARGHLRRAFACAVLLRGGAEPGNAAVEFLSEPDTLAQLLASAAVLGEDVERATLRFLAWWALRPPVAGRERAYFAIALAMLVVRLEGTSRDPAWSEQLAWWVMRQAEPEGRGWEWEGGGYQGQRHGVWQDLASRMRSDIERLPPGDGRELMGVVAGLIAS